MPRLPTRLLAKLPRRDPSRAGREPSTPESRLLRVRRISSALLIVAGAALITATLASSGGSAMQDEPAPPAGPVAQLAAEASPRKDPPIRVEAPSTQSLANPTGSALPVVVIRGQPFIWPAEGPLTSEMGPWHTLGIDIGLDYDVDSPIWAAAGGTVKFAGGEVWETYGHHVLLDHGGGMETLYGHFYEVFVEEGELVEQGQLLGFGGDTGIAEGKHLHFEVRRDKALIDPQHVLPPRDDDGPEQITADCGQEALVIDSGAPLTIDFRQALTAAVVLSGVMVEKVAVSPAALPVAATVEAATTVRFDSRPTVTGTGADDEYRLLATAGTGAGAVELACTVFVRTTTVAPSYYVRPTNTPTPPPPTATPIPPTPTETPTPTPTPTPTKTPFPSRRR